jgi:CheY-like chemotaxis protein
MLDPFGCHHEEVGDAEAALDTLRGAAAQGHPFAVVLLDSRLAGAGGEALGKEIAADLALKDTMLVLMLEMGKRGQSLRLDQAGFSAYLTKPIQQAGLRECLVALFRKNEAEPGASRRRLVTQESLSRSKRRGIRVLVAEDNLTNQQVILKILQKLGYQADAVGTGLHAVKAVEAQRYDVVLMDIQMPEMDGFEATAIIRSGKLGGPAQEVPIIAMTACALKGDREKCIALGMNDYLAKPVDPRLLASTVDRWAFREGLAPAVAAPEARGPPSSR